MRVLHVWDQAGVAAVLAKYQKRLGWDVIVVKRAGFDKYGIDSFYGTRIFDGSTWKFYRFVRRLAKNFDLAHIHGAHKISVLMPRKRKVVEFHGSDIRNHNNLWNWMAKKLAGEVLVSTPDLLSIVPEAEWLPNPIDTEHFRKNCYAPKPKTALHILQWYKGSTEYCSEKACQIASKMGLDLMLIDNIPYWKMPTYLCQFEYFIDARPPSLSKTTLEALACGLKVIRWDGKVLEGLPERHRPENVANRTIEIYNRIL